MVNRRNLLSEPPPPANPGRTIVLSCPRGGWLL